MRQAVRAGIGLGAGMAGALMGFSAAALGGDGLGSVRWSYRPLLIFTPAGDDPRLSRQTTMLADDSAALAERRMAVYIVEADRVFTTFGAPAPEAEARALRRRFRIPDDGFRVVLIGLDGGEKLRREMPITTEELFATIDSMPMRRRELKERGEGGDSGG